MDYPKEVLSGLFSNQEIGLALFEMDTLNPLYENGLFLDWFPKGDTQGLTDRISSINISRMHKKLTRGTTYSCECEIKKNNRSKIIKLFFSNKNTSLFVKAIDYTKEKEVEYLLDSYVKMSEKDKKQLEASLELISKQKEALIRSNSALERERNSIELRALQAVINPHFVSNCLASIQRFIMDHDTELSVNYLSYFGRLMRMSFDQSYHDYVSIAEIIQLLETYVAIEKIRINHDWEFIMQLDKKLDVANSKIPPLLIQPFLENAIWHGINGKKQGGKIVIHFEVIDDITLKCSIEDNGVGRKVNTAKKDQQKRAALHSLNVTGKRLDIMWQEHQKNYTINYTDLKTIDGTPTGTKVELYIPISF